MMNLTPFEQLLSRAKKDIAPSVNVTDNVMMRIHQGLLQQTGKPDYPLSPFAWIAGLSAAAMIPISIGALHAFSVLLDPLNDYFESLLWTIN